MGQKAKMGLRVLVRPSPLACTRDETDVIYAGQTVNIGPFPLSSDATHHNFGYARVWRLPGGHIGRGAPLVT